MKYLGFGVLAFGLALSGCVTPPEPEKAPPVLPGRVVEYKCAAGGSVTVDYGEGKVTLPGPETLIQEEGVQRWSWPSDGTHHIWALDGAGVGTLSLSSAGSVAVEKSGCVAKS
ncbi:hypothetical protein NX862_02705 [Rhodobacter sp. KR11]|jgi:hypothetical protein|uniref:hypothetical protein n=1 Tax=Rhodobacter sp. KR11 TaxID=2974588 RepID=UPI002221A4B3|nr:hypothetical protein [Rhodobacter sp. KR11]MCW1917653.1 hypothetical protein [Rhodobacter sp. KR11]